MELLQQLQHFTKSEILQGKWMIVTSIFVLFPLAFLLFKSDLSLQKGMVIPVGLLAIICVAYGSYIVYSKPKHFEKIETEFYSNPKENITAELEKAKVDDKSYTTLKYVWGIAAIAFIVFYFLLTKDFHKGLSLGFSILFLSFLLIDTFFHQRLNTYLEELNKLTS